MNIAAPIHAITKPRTLKGKISLVTGSTSGIGLGIARALAAEGSNLVLNGFGNADEIAATTQQLIADYSVQAFHSPADMSKADSIAEMIEKTLKIYGRIDILVNNAGIQHVAPVQEFPIAKWEAIIAINMSSAFHTIRLALPA